VSAPLADRLREEITASMRSGDKVRLGALRMLSAAVTNREKEVRHELDDDEIRDVAAKEVKKRTEAIEAFSAAGRDELVAKETAERETLAAYAPEQVSEAEIDAVIDEAFAAAGATGPQDLGKVMGPVMAKLKGRADGALVQRKVKARLEAPAS
jgi:uncharacterized protein YqeY